MRICIKYKLYSRAIITIQWKFLEFIKIERPLIFIFDRHLIFRRFYIPVICTTQLYLWELYHFVVICLFSRSFGPWSLSIIEGLWFFISSWVSFIVCAKLIVLILFYPVLVLWINQGKKQWWKWWIDDVRQLVIGV